MYKGDGKMSIIYDALNKVQNKTKSTNPDTAPEPKKSKKLFITAIIIILSVTVLLVIQNLREEDSIDSTVKAPLAKQKNILNSGNIKNDAGQANNNAGEFDLSGIFVAEDDITAIINDAIVTIGNSVNGATVVKIENESVELEREGEKFILSMR